MSASTPRAVVIGWDCAAPALTFERFADIMPHFTALRERGCWGKLRSSHPPITVPAWTCMLTSHNPGRLGFYGFRNRKPGGYAAQWIATNAAVHAPRVWDLLSQQGKRVCAFNVPQTYPVKPVNGVVVSSFLTPSTDSDFTHPLSLKAELEQVCDGYLIDVDNFRTEDKASLLKQIYTVSDKHHRAVLHLLDQQPWDFFMQVNMGPDRLHHGFWKFCDPQHPKYKPGNRFQNALSDFYTHLDEQLGEILERVDDEALVLVVSDHGAKAMKGSFSINDYFLQEGLLTLKEPVPPHSRLDEGKIDWPRTRAWAWGGYYSRVFLNVAGREPEGTIAPSEYERVRQEIADLIRAIPDDQGHVMNTQVFRPQELFTGPYVDEAPDLFAYLDDLSWRVGQDLNNGNLYRFDTEIGPDDAVHDHEGTFVMAGPKVSSRGELAGLQLMDVAPTVLHHLGLEPPADMEGQVIR